MPVVRHTPSWTEDNFRSDKTWVVFRCDICGDTQWIKRSEYDRGKMPSTSPHSGSRV
jgi:hypothetical protein